MEDIAASYRENSIVHLSSPIVSLSSQSSSKAARATSTSFTKRLRQDYSSRSRKLLFVCGCVAFLSKIERELRVGALRLTANRLHLLLSRAKASNSDKYSGNLRAKSLRS